MLADFGARSVQDRHSGLILGRHRPHSARAGRPMQKAAKTQAEAIL